MSHAPILLFLHGVGAEPDDSWQAALELSLVRLGYPDLSSVKVVAPKYPNSLNGVDDDEPRPKVTVKAPRGDDAERNRRDFERRRTAMEVLLGPDDRGEGLPGGDQIAPMAAEVWLFNQAKNYTENPKVRAWVLRRILKHLPESGRLVIVGHSLGSVIAADLLRRLPTGLEVAGMVTIGSPLAHKKLQVDDLRELLAEPPVNLSWWVNFWSTADLVPARRGISTVYPWVLDQRIRARPGFNPVQAHSAATYLQSDTVAAALGRGLFGSRSKEIARVEEASRSNWTIQKRSRYWHSATHTSR
jgi:pimeloyl-ACP methyl ester carboxylesterase